MPTPPNVILVHGMELGFANAVEEGAFAGVRDTRVAAGIFMAATALAIALLGGCTIAPVTQTEGLPRVSKHPVNAGVYYSPQFAKQEKTRTRGIHVFTVPIGPASVQLFDNVLPRVFEKTSRLSTLSTDEIAAKQADVVLVPSLENFDFRMVSDSDSERYSVIYRFTLYSNQLVPVTSWVVKGKERAKRARSNENEVENNMRDAATKFVRGFDSNAGPALAAIERQSKGQGSPIDRRGVVLGATRSDLPDLDPKVATALRAAGVVAMKVVARNGTDRPLVMRASDVRLKLKNGSVLEPATVSAILSLLDEVSYAGLATDVLVGTFFGGLVVDSEQKSQQEERERQSTAVDRALFRERTLGKGKAESGVIPFIVPKGTAAEDAVSLTAWIVDPASADGLRIEVPLAKR